MGMGIGFQLMETLFPLLFILFFVVFFVILIRGILQWHKNNQSPRLTVEATIVTKRRHVTHHNGGAAGSMGTTSTSYYVTFQVASGDRMELRVSGQEYGMLAEGDRGQLTFQGTRYLDFQRM